MASILKIGGSWRAQIRRKDHNETATFSTKAAALEWARKVESDIDAKKRAKIHGATGISIADAIDAYRQEMTIGRTKDNVLGHLKTGLGAVQLSDLTPQDIIKYVKERGYGPSTAQIELSILGTLLKVAGVAWKYHVPENVVKTARDSLKMTGKVKKSRQRDRRPTAKELKDLCAYFDKKSTLPMRDLIWFAIHTAMRAGEITRLRWADYNRKHKTIVIRDRKDPHEKMGNHQTVPLLDEAIKIIERQPEDGELIFPYNEATFSSIFPRACQALGIEDLRWHDLRHEGASRLFERGYQIHEVALFTGHKDWAMLKRYTQLRAKDLRRL
jgi:integrase